LRGYDEDVVEEKYFWIELTSGAGGENPKLPVCRPVEIFSVKPNEDRDFS
jgi:hypothetical protein